MAKVKRTETGRWMFYCPGCDSHHGPNDTWKFNGNVDKPTFQPSLLVEWYKYDDPDHIWDENGKVIVGPDGNIPGKKMICHSFITDGKIQYLPDCTHALAGQTVEMEERDE